MEIEIGKFKVWDTATDVSDTLKAIKRNIVTEENIYFDFAEGVYQGSSIKLQPRSENDYPDKSEVSKKDFVDKLLSILNNDYYNQGRFSSVSKKEGSDSVVNTTTFKFSIIMNINPSPFYEQPSGGVSEYTIEADLKWTEGGAERTGSWIE